MYESQGSPVLARAARVLGWLALAVAASAAAPFLVPQSGVGRGFAFCAWMSLVAVLLGGVAVALNSGARRPRSRVPAIALVAGGLLVAFYVYVIHELAGLFTMH